MQHIGVVKRLFMKVRPPAAAVRDSQQQRIALIPRMEWDFYGFPSGEFQVWGVKCQAKEGGGPRLRIGDWKMSSGGAQPTKSRRAQNKANLGVESCQTNPISRRRRRPMKAIVRNEAKLGATGVCGQERLSCVVRPGSEMCRTKPIWGPEAQDCGLMIADCGLRKAPRRRRPEAKCAKRTQFRAVGVPLRIVQNKANLA
jgi:hypothetical protein